MDEKRMKNMVLLLAIILAVLDAAITYIGMGIGGIEEANPVLAHMMNMYGPWIAFIYLPTFVATIVYIGMCILEELLHSTAKSAYTFMTLLSVLYTYVFYNNIMLLIKTI